jgi:putative ABC transport system permease protein
MTGGGSHRGLLVRIALRGIQHDALTFTCFAFGLAALLSPLLLLLSIKSGVIDKMRGDLLGNPRITEISSVGNRAFEPGFLRAIAGDPRVSFVVPRTRALSATIYVEARNRPGEIVPAELVPTAPGDPLVPDVGRDDPAIGIVPSQELAARLGLSVGQTTTLSAVRVTAGRRERAVVAAVVAGVAPQSTFRREAVFADVALLAGLEDYLDGRADGWHRVNTDDRTMAGFRLHVIRIEDVGDVARALATRGVDAVTNADMIDVVLNLDHNLTTLYTVVAVIAGIGFATAFGASMFAMVEGRRRVFALLRMVGLPARSMRTITLLQAATVAVAGIVLATALTAIGAAIVNGLFVRVAGTEGRVADLSWRHVVVLGTATLVVALLATTLAGRRAARIDPVEVSDVD